jgi:TRAP-type transport system small permease protein
MTGRPAGLPVNGRSAQHSLSRFNTLRRATMQRMIQRTVAVFSKFTASGASLSMAVLFLIVFTNSIRRYTLGKSLQWGEELPVFIAIYGVMFGMTWAYL